MPEFYTYEAGMHCAEHAHERFGSRLNDPNTTDREGNPIGAVFNWEVSEGDYCEECAYEAIERRNKRRRK